MAGVSKAPTGLPPRKNSMRPPFARPFSNRTQSSAPLHQSKGQPRPVSPAISVTSQSTNSSRPRSPTHRNGSTKRKERDFDSDGEEETNIHVVVRCRGRNDREVRENSGVVVSTDGVKGKSVELSMGPSALSNKTFTFDKVFAPAADQAMIYDDVVIPLLGEMLHGYNCTIFAYGQTGTGKTYTMSGDMSDTQGLLSESAGIIPRVLYSLFSKLEADEVESSVKCSFIELYNEELRDLLSTEEHIKLKIYEDSQKKGHSTTVVQGIEESHIKTAGAGVKLLQSGSHKRQVAATKCNDLSSRSHTVFTITVYIKRTAEDGEDFVSAGKLNLVDLAGSENIQRSGAENKRAAEAGLINKSLLTLGRVINALVDKSSHIPYRESKLTRLLQDSLGGRTKTCIIATVSPAKSNLEETISTLDYAFRAKNIRNKPQINQTISKKTLLREFTTEIEKLKSELIATRQRNGVYLTTENYEEITEESESRRILSEEQRAKIETMEANLRNKVQELFSLTTNFNVLKRDNEAAKQALNDTSNVLEKTEIVLADTRGNLAEEMAIRNAHERTEEQLHIVGDELISVVERTVNDVGGLHAKLRRKSELQGSNRKRWKSSQDDVSTITRLIEGRIDKFQIHNGQLLTKLSISLDEFLHAELAKLYTSQVSQNETMLSFEASEKVVLEQTTDAKNDMNDVLEEIKVLREEVKQKVGGGLQGLSAAAGRISAGVINELEECHNQLHASYSTLGKDFKSIFEDLVNHLNTQKSEVESLGHQLSTANQTAIRKNIALSNCLDASLAEERELATRDRQMLLLQITDLVNNSGDARDSRLSSRVSSVRENMETSRNSLETANSNFNNGMDVWSSKEGLLIEEVLKSRETMKCKMKRDWTAISEHNDSIQRTTRSVHEETVRIVDAQMRNMAVQMKALDDFVLRARSQNDCHSEAHVLSLQDLGSRVKQSYSSIGEEFEATKTRIQGLKTDTSAQTSSLQSSLPPLKTDICQPLSGLREQIVAAPLVEYTATGETPQKIQYQYPKVLPRTEGHENLLQKLHREDRGHLPSEDLDAGSASPSKSIIYTDNQVDEVALIRSTIPASDQKPAPGGLKEVHVNVSVAPSRNSDPLVASLSSSITRRPDFENPLSFKGPPSLKRHATMESKLPQKFGHSKSGIIPSEGRENNPPVSAGLGVSRRRLRSSPAE